MTDRTHPDSGRIITSSDILLHDAETALLYEELRAAIDDGHESMTHADAMAEIAAIRAENEKLEAQLAAIGAGGVSGPLMGRTDSKERAAKAAETWLRDKYGAYRGHFAWRELEEAFLAGRASLAASAGGEPVAQPGDAEAILSEICDLLCIGKLARNESTILANIRNAIDHAGLLHAVERDLFPQPELPEDDDPYAAVDEGLPAPNCWAAKDEADYVAQFRAALAARGFNAQGLREGVASAGSEPVAQLAAERDELFQAAIDFIRTLTGMEPPPIEVAPPEVFAPFHAFVNTVQAIINKRNSSPREGMVMVPKEPTHHMLNAAASAYEDARQSLGAYNAPWAAYRAMLEAAPPTTSAGSKGE